MSPSTATPNGNTRTDDDDVGEPPAALLSNTTRLIIGLSVSSVVLFGLAAAGNLFGAVACLVPLVVATRCLPLSTAMPLMVFAPALGRVLGVVLGGEARGDNTAGLLSYALGASALWLVPLLADRVASTWLPRAGAFALPCALVVLERVLSRPAVPEGLQRLAQLPLVTSTADGGSASARVLALWAGDLSSAAVLFFVALLATAVGGLATVHNRVADPVPTPERDASLRFTGVVALIAFLVIAVGGGVRLARGASIDPPANGDVVVLACAVVLAVVMIAALPAKKKRAA